MAFVLMVGSMLTLNSCYKDKEELLYGNTTCDTTQVSFSADIMPIVAASCGVIGCHVQGGASVVIFENYNHVKASVDNGTFQSRVLVMKNMPPSTPLSECQLLHIQAWINQQALNN